MDSNAQYTIVVPSGLFDDRKKARNYLFEELNTCFLMYKGEFGINPDSVEFNGKVGVKIHRLLHDIFDGVYECKFNEHWCNSVIFRNLKTKKVHKVTDSDENTVQMDSSAKIKNGSIQPGLYSGSTADLYSMMNASTGINFKMETDVETVMEFQIRNDDDFKSDPVPSDNGLISFF